MEAITEQYYNDKNIHKSKTRLEIPKQKDGSKYSLKKLSKQQQAFVIASIDTIVKFLKNDKKYKPLQATVMGCGQTGKSFIINTIISVRNMTQMNDTVKVGAPSGAAAYNVQGSTLHRLLRINVSRPEEKVTGTVLENLQECLKHLLCIIIDEEHVEFKSSSCRRGKHPAFCIQGSK